jgi:hypothetical protein
MSRQACGARNPLPRRGLRRFRVASSRSKAPPTPLACARARVMDSEAPQGGDGRSRPRIYAPLHNHPENHFGILPPSEPLVLVSLKVCGPLVSASAGGFFYSIALDFWDAFIYV